MCRRRRIDPEAAKRCGLQLARRDSATVAWLKSAPSPPQRVETEPIKRLVSCCRLDRDGSEAVSATFRFGCQAFSAESLGYSAFHLADHYFGPGAAMQAASHPPQNLAAVPAMMAAAAATERVLIGCRVMCVDYHQPVVLAKELATIDLLSDGRLEAGFGAGWVTSEYEAMGIAMAAPGERIDRMAEYVELAKSWFRGIRHQLHHSRGFEHGSVCSRGRSPRRHLNEEPGGTPCLR
jgi:alkanesulfonate monooxygenase SsuD/methylene tetrahydromethanopterin reductase-like flavin-dependent oxidoreductase (luciferase family)